MQILGDAYALILEGDDINGFVSFKIPDSFKESKTENTLFTAKYLNGEWIRLASVIKGDFVVSSVSNEGTFALMSPADKEPTEKDSVPKKTNATGMPFVFCLLLISLAVAITVKLRK